MKTISGMNRRELSKLGIIKEDNYYKIFNRRKKGASIKIIYPYGMDHSDYYIDFYLNSLITFIDEHFTKQKLDVALSYEIFFNKSVITIDMVDSYNLNIALGIFFNAIRKDDLLNMLLEYKINLQYKLDTDMLSNFNMMVVDNISMEELARNAYNDLINDTMDLSKIKYLKQNMINELSPVIVVESNQRNITLDLSKNDFFNINKRKLYFDITKLASNVNLVFIDKDYDNNDEYIKDYNALNLYELLFVELNLDVKMHIVKEINNKLVLFLYTDNHDKDYIHNTIKLIHKDDNIFNFYKKNIKLKLKDNFNKIDTAKGLTNHIITNMPIYETFDELIKDELVITNVIEKLVNETEE